MHRTQCPGGSEMKRGPQTMLPEKKTRWPSILRLTDLPPSCVRGRTQLAVCPASQATNLPCEQRRGLRKVHLGSVVIVLNYF